MVEPTAIGKAGGTGSITFNIDTETLMFQSGFAIGTGAGSTGTLNVLGAGKSPAHAPICTSSYCEGREIRFGAYAGSGTIDTVGENGGTGTLTVSGAALSNGYQGYGPDLILRVGSGIGSAGTVNILASGKLGNIGSMGYNADLWDHINTSSGKWDPISMFQIGVNGGNGTLNIDNSSMVLQNGLHIGSGAGSTGTVNLTGGGFAHTFTNTSSSYCLPDAPTQCLYDPNPAVSAAVRQRIGEELSVKVGIDGGTGAINVLGANSIWYVSGLFQDYSYYMTDTQSDAGDLYIGYSGTGSLTIGDGGAVKIGTGIFMTGEREVAHKKDADGNPIIASHQWLETDTFIADGTLHLGYKAGSKGTLNIGAAPGNAAVAPGTLEAGKIVFGSGTGSAINFNHTSRNYVFDDTISDGIYGNGEINAVAGRTILNKDQPNFTGNLTASTGILQVNGNYSQSSATTVLNGGRLEGIGTVSATTNSGIIAPGTVSINDAGVETPVIGTLTIAGDYIGNNGTLVFDTTLEKDDSTTDRLIIQGNVSGHSNVIINNFNGMGALTIQDGIKIIQVDGTSPADAFALKGDFTTTTGQQAVIGGAYGYTMWHNGLSGADGAWYLRSEMRPPPDPGPGPDPGEPNVVLYQPLSPVAEAYPRVLLSFLQSETLEQRTSNRQWNGLTSATGTEYTDGSEQFIWARLKAGRSSLEPHSSTTGTTLDYNYWSFKSGIDGMVYQNGENSIIAGVNVFYGQTSADTKNYLYGHGKIDTTGYGIGTTLTWFGANGYYVDGQAQATLFDSDLSSSIIGRLVNGDGGFGYSLSLEGGKKFILNDAWSITPQLQLSYANVNNNSFRQERFGTKTEIDGGEQLIGRLGVTAEYQQTWKGEAGDLRRARVYGSANIYNDFLSKTHVDIAGTKIFSKNEALWGGIGLGAAYNWGNDKYSLYGEANIKSSFENSSDNYDVSGQIGFRIKW